MTGVLATLQAAAAVVAPLDGYVAPSLGAVLLLMIGWAVTLLRGISKELKDHGTKIAEMSTAMFGLNGSPSLVGKVTDLHAWKNAETKRQLVEANERADRLQVLDDQRHGPPDRRAR